MNPSSYSCEGQFLFWMSPFMKNKEVNVAQINKAFLYDILYYFLCLSSSPLKAQLVYLDYYYFLYIVDIYMEINSWLLEVFCKSAKLEALFTGRYALVMWWADPWGPEMENQP